MLILLCEGAQWRWAPQAGTIRIQRRAQLDNQVEQGNRLRWKVHDILACKMRTAIAQRIWAANAMEDSWRACNAGCAAGAEAEAQSRFAMLGGMLCPDIDLADQPLDTLLSRGLPICEGCREALQRL